MSRLRRLLADPETLQADDLLAQARQALREGRRLDARRWVWAALQIQPSHVRAWLMLAVLGSPRASLNYVNRALQARPSDPIAHAALRWARQRVDIVEASRPTSPTLALGLRKTPLAN